MAWRFWRVRESHPVHLFSLVRDNQWRPGVPMTGDVRDFGVFAIKEDLLHEFASQIGSCLDPNDGAVVLGKVELWGEVVEHEDGYRAEFASIISLDAWIEFAIEFREVRPGLVRPGHVARLDRDYQFVHPDRAAFIKLLHRLRERYVPSQDIVP